MKSTVSEPFNPGNLRPWSDWFLNVVLAVAVLYCAAFLFILFCDIDKRMSDFDVYYYRTKAYNRGENPYDREPANLEGGGQIACNKYCYPPMTLPLFGLFTKLDRRPAAFIYLGLKCVCLGFLIWLWVTRFNPANVDGRILWIAILLAFGRAINKDLDAGNIVIFEELGIWLAMACFLQRRWFCYAGLIALVSFFKLTPLVLLGLCFMQRDRRAWLAAAIVGIVYLAILFSPLDNARNLLPTFFAAAAGSEERGSVNPSSAAALCDLAESLVGRPAGKVRFWNSPGLMLYGSFALVVAGLALSALIRNRWKLPLVDVVMLGIFTYALGMPRFKDYSYILLIMPALYVVWTCMKSDLLRLATILMMCFHFYRYQQWSVMAALFLVYVIHLQRRAQRETPLGPPQNGI